MKSMQSAATVYMVGTPIGNLSDLSIRAKEVLCAVPFVACEDTRRTQQLLSSIGSRAETIRLDAHAPEKNYQRCIELAMAGHDLAYVSDAGMPGTSDPGARLVQAAAECGLAVTAVPGPSAVTTAIALSGFDAAGFFFSGYMPRKEGERKQALQTAQLANLPWVIFLSPHRIHDEMQWLNENASGSDFCLCRELTKKFETVHRGTLGFFDANDIKDKGEFVLVLRVQASADDDSSSALKEYAQKLYSRGLEGRALADTLQEIFDCSKKEAYSASLEVKD